MFGVRDAAYSLCTFGQSLYFRSIRAYPSVIAALPAAGRAVPWRHRGRGRAINEGAARGQGWARASPPRTAPARRGTAPARAAAGSTPPPPSAVAAPPPPRQYTSYTSQRGGAWRGGARARNAYRCKARLARSVPLDVPPDAEPLAVVQHHLRGCCCEGFDTLSGTISATTSVFKNEECARGAARAPAAPACPSRTRRPCRRCASSPP